MSDLWVCGVDEAGRGPLVGAVVAGAVVLDPDKPIDGLKDSKKLTATKRDFLYEQILASQGYNAPDIVDYYILSRKSV